MSLLTPKMVAGSVLEVNRSTGMQGVAPILRFVGFWQHGDQLAWTCLQRGFHRITGKGRP